MKKLLTIACTCLLSLTLGACSSKSEATNLLEKVKENGKIVMAVSPDFAPYEFIDPTKTGNDQYVGADIELGKYIAEKMGLELELKVMDFQTVLTAVTQSKVDMAISGLGYKPDRAEAMEFSHPYNTSEENCHGLLVKKSDEAKFETLADFTGLRIAAQSASLQEGYTKEQIKDAQLDIIASLGDGILRLQNGKSDALATACTTGEQYAKANPDLAMSGVVFELEVSDGTMVGIPKGETEFVAAVNEIIDEVVEKGLYKQWETEYTEYADSLGIE